MLIAWRQRFTRGAGEAVCQGVGVLRSQREGYLRRMRELAVRGDGMRRLELRIRRQLQVLAVGEAEARGEGQGRVPATGSTRLLHP
jgi:hypothetical protein